jgi:hypothetical protein
MATQWRSNPFNEGFLHSQRQSQFPGPLSCGTKARPSSSGSKLFGVSDLMGHGESFEQYPWDLAGFQYAVDSGLGCRYSAQRGQRILQTPSAQCPVVRTYRTQVLDAAGLQ